MVWCKVKRTLSALRVNFRRLFSSLLGSFMSPYSKRKMVLSSLVGYFLKLDAMDDANIKRINSLMGICDYSYEAMRLPIMLSNTIWKGVNVDEMASLTEQESKAYLLRHAPYFLRYQGLDKDVSDFLKQLREGFSLMKHN